MPTTCVRCHAPDGAHYPWCTMASLFERLLGSPGQVAGEPPPPDLIGEPDPGETQRLHDLLDQRNAELEHERRLRADAEAALVGLQQRHEAATSQVEILRREVPSHDERVSARRLEARASRAETERDARARELENARREATELQRQLTRAVDERNRAVEERNRLQAVLGTRAPQGTAERNRAAVTADQSRRTAEAQADRRLDAAVKEVEAAGAKVEVAPPPAPKPAPPKAAEPPKAAPALPEAPADLPPYVRPAPPDKYPAGSEQAQRSREAADLLAAAELFVSEQVEKAPGHRVRSPDLLRAFAEWLPTIGFAGKFTTPVMQARQVGLVMGRAGYGKRQFKEADGSQPTNYLGARLKGARESESKEGNHPSPNGLAAPVAAPAASVADMRAAAREARRHEGAGRVSLKPDKPGKELKSEPIRKMATRLVEEAGWTYERPAGRLNSHPRLVAPDGDKITLPSTPSVQGQVVTTRAKLRRKLRALGHPNPAAVLP